jgi:hypothetical protein
MAHTRLATTGGISIENAHPFKVGGVIGAHNGMVFNHNYMNIKHSRSCEVDSQHIFYHINEGIELKELYGYGSIEWVMKDDPDRILLCKMSDTADLAAVKLENGAGVVWSSSLEHLKKALTRAGLSGSMWKINEEQVYAVYGSVLYRRDEKIELGSSYATSIICDDYCDEYGFYNHRERSNRGWRSSRNYYSERFNSGQWENGGDEEQLSLCDENMAEWGDAMAEADPGCGTMSCKRCPFLESCVAAYLAKTEKEEFENV